MDNSFYISDLIAKKNKGTISPKEMEKLESWMNESSENLEIYTRATDNNYLVNKLEVYQLFRKNEVREALENELFPAKTRKLYPNVLLRYAAVLIPLMLLAGVSWYYLNESKSPPLSSLDTVVKPGSQKAMLKLSDGKTLELDDSNLLAELQEGDAKVINEQHSLIYSSEEESAAPKAVVYNELITPRGGGYKLQLADGTVVTMNAGSSLKYPVSFSDSIRQVFLEGEAYFDVSHNGKPFLVSCESMDVRVLGTSFNVSSYADDAEIRTTLVEGKVKVTTDGNSNLASEGIILAPDDQAIFSRDDASVEVVKVNTSQYTSWVMGKFEFSNANMDEVMKRLARWYDFEYEFERDAAKDYHFTARIDNNQSISSILEMLEMTTDVKFEIKDQKIVIL
jgi:ferric-dicitrate binding protein FerR (iron transport regulator)